MKRRLYNTNVRATARSLPILLLAFVTFGCDAPVARFRTNVAYMRSQERLVGGDFRFSDAQKQDVAMRKGMALKETLKSLQKDNDRKNIKKVLTITKALNLKLKKMQARIDDRVKQQEEAEGQVSKYNDAINKLEQEIQELLDDIKSIVEMAKIRQPSTGVRVTGTAYDRSSIRGRNASLIVKGNMQRVHFQEIKNPDEKSDQAWLMSVASI